MDYLRNSLISVFLLLMSLAWGGKTAGAGEERIPTVSTAIHVAPQSPSSLEGWSQNDFEASLNAFLKACPTILARQDLQEPLHPAIHAFGTVEMWQKLCHRARSAPHARRFFQKAFVPIIVGSPYASTGKLQGVIRGTFLPRVMGSSHKTEQFSWPLLPYPSKTQKAYLDEPRIQLIKLARWGALKPLAWIRPHDALFLSRFHGLSVHMDSGRVMHFWPVGTNHFPTLRIADILIYAKEFPLQHVSTGALSSWFQANQARFDDAMALNPSVIFYERVEQLPFVPIQGRSLMVDGRFYPFGMPIWVGLRPRREQGEDGHLAFSPQGLNDHLQGKLMIVHGESLVAQGPQQADIFLGTGHLEAQATQLNHAGMLIALIPRTA